MNENVRPAGSVVNVRELAARVPAHPSPLINAPPDYDEVAGTADFLVDCVLDALDPPRDFTQEEMLQTVQTTFNTHVGSLMHRRGLSREDAIRQACEVVERALQGAQRR